MKKQSFSLQPFEKDMLDIRIRGQVARRKNIITVRYELMGDLGKIDIPGPKQSPSRVKGLWESTCFELFLSPRGRQEYWEINVSPSGDWNVFCFERYKEKRSIDNLREETSVASLPSSSQRQPGSLILDFEIDLGELIHQDRSLETGISAIIKSTQKRTYWALAHRGPKPDFHRRDGFILKLQQKN